MRLMCGQHCLSSNPGQSPNTRMCGLCDRFDVESVSHFMFICTHFAETRNTLWAPVVESMPLSMSQHVRSLNVNDKVQFLLSGFRVNFTPEWLDVYESVAMFVLQLYRERRKISY